MLILKECGIALDTVDKELIWYELNDDGTVNHDIFGVVESMPNKELKNSFISLSEGL